MKLPSQLQHFPSPTLVIVTDSVWAIFFLVHGETMEELERLHLPRERKQDAEGEFFAPANSQVGSGGFSDPDDEHRLESFAQQIIDRMKRLMTAHDIQRVHLITPPHVDHVFTQHLPKPLEEHVVQRLHLDLVKTAPVEIIERLLAD